MRTTATVPNYLLYGEAVSERFPDVLHCETIPARSEAHDWRIRPHRHLGVLQVFLIAGGDARALIDGEEREITAPAAILMPAGEVHGFAFAPGTDGWVVSLPAETAIGDEAGEGATRLSRPFVHTPSATEFASLLHLFGEVEAEYGGTAPGRARALAALASLLLIRFARLDPAAFAGPDDLPEPLRRFLALVETRHREQPTIAALAADLGLTPTHLTRLCRARLGRGAHEILQERSILEAKRDLAYTSRSLAEIAERLGYADPSWFSKVFRAKVGVSPSAWRAAGPASPAQAPHPASPALAPHPAPSPIEDPAS